MPKISTYPIASSLSDNDRFLINGAGGLVTQTVRFSTLVTAVAGRVYRASDYCACDASLSDPTVGTDDSVALQALIVTVNSAGGGIILVDGPIKCGEVNVYSNIHFVGLYRGSWYGTGTAPVVGFIQTRHTKWMFSNLNRVSSYNGGTPITDFSLIQDYNITFEDLFFNGNFRGGDVDSANAGLSGSTYVARGTSQAAAQTNWADSLSVTGGWFIAILDFAGVRNVRIENCWFFDYVFRACSFVQVDKLISKDNVSWGQHPSFSQSRTSDNMDHFHVRDVRIENHVYWNSDDSILFATEPAFSFVPSAYAPWVYGGPITGVRIVNPKQYNGNGPAVALYSGSAETTNLMDDVICTGLYCPSFVLIQTLGGTGNFGRIKFKDSYFTGDKWFKIQLVTAGNTIVLDGITADHVSTSSADPAINVTQSTIKSLEIRNVNVVDSTATAGTMVSVNSSNVMRSVTLDNIVWERRSAIEGTGSVAGTVLSYGQTTAAFLKLSNIKTRGTGNTINIAAAATPYEIFLDGIEPSEDANNPTILANLTSSTALLRASGVGSSILTNRPTLFSDMRTDSIQNPLVLFDGFVGSNNTNLTAYTPDYPAATLWTAQQGTIEIQSNLAQIMTNGADGYALYFREAGISDLVVSAVMAAGGSNNYGLVIRATDKDNLWLIRKVALTASLALFEIAGAVVTQRAEVSVNFGVTYVVKIKAVGTTITISANDATNGNFLSASYASASSNLTATKVGLRGLVGGTYGNFLVNSTW